MAGRLVNCSVTETSPGLFSVTAYTTGDTCDQAIEKARFVLSVVAPGKAKFVRTAPEATVLQDFVSGATLVQGYVRFTFTDYGGATADTGADRDEPVRYLGFGAIPTGESH